MNVWRDSSARAQITGAGLLLALAAVLAVTDLSGDQKLMVLIGAVLVMTGNSMPKALRPLSRMRCETATEQAIRRGTAWFFVLVGLSWIASWLALSEGLATSITIVTSAVTTVVIAAVVMWCRSTRAGDRPSAET